MSLSNMLSRFWEGEMTNLLGPPSSSSSSRSTIFETTVFHDMGGRVVSGHDVIGNEDIGNDITVGTERKATSFMSFRELQGLMNQAQSDQEATIARRKQRELAERNSTASLSVHNTNAFNGKPFHHRSAFENQPVKSRSSPRELQGLSSSGVAGMENGLPRAGQHRSSFEDNPPTGGGEGAGGAAEGGKPEDKANEEIKKYLVPRLWKHTEGVAEVSITKNGEKMTMANFDVPFLACRKGKAKLALSHPQLELVPAFKKQNPNFMPEKYVVKMTMNLSGEESNKEKTVWDATYNVGRFGDSTLWQDFPCDSSQSRQCRFWQFCSPLDQKEGVVYKLKIKAKDSNGEDIEEFGEDEIRLRVKPNEKEKLKKEEEYTKYAAKLEETAEGKPAEQGSKDTVITTNQGMDSA